MDNNRQEYTISEAYQFVKDYQRMCQTIGNCNKCPLYSLRTLQLSWNTEE